MNDLTRFQGAVQRIDPVRMLGVALAGIAAKAITERAWTATTGRAPPEDPARSEVGLREAVAWTVAVGVAIGLARLLAGRVAHRVRDE